MATQSQSRKLGIEKVVIWQYTYWQIAKLSFNFNYNLVESWDSINFIFNTHPPNHPPTHPPPQEKSK